MVRSFLLTISMLTSLSVIASDRFHYLNQLPKGSILKKVCSESPRGWISKGEVEKECEWLNMALGSSEHVFKDGLAGEMEKDAIRVILADHSDYTKSKEWDKFNTLGSELVRKHKKEVIEADAFEKSGRKF